MKDKILLFIIGVLTGAILATGTFYAYSKINSSNDTQPGMNGGTPPSMPNGQNGQPPELPNSNNAQENSESINN